MKRLVVAAMVLALSGWGPSAYADVQGAGASFPSKVYTKWSEQYKKQPAKPSSTSPPVRVMDSSNHRAQGWIRRL